MVSIFIRTYEKDLQWLSYCLASIHRNLKGWDEIVICIPEGQKHLLKGIVASERVVTSPLYSDDYIGQQISKLHAYRHVAGEYVLFVDSDLVFHPGAQVSDYFRDGKPVILKESYARLDGRHPELNMPKWQAVVYLVFGERPSYEYMRRAPQLFRTSTLIALDKAFPKMEAHAVSQPKRLFSEFNVLGYFAEKHESVDYTIIDLEFEAFPPNLATQNWSWSGITPAIFTQFVQLGVADPAHPPVFTGAPTPEAAPAPKMGRWKRFRYSIKRFFRGY